PERLAALRAIARPSRTTRAWLPGRIRRQSGTSARPASGVTFPPRAVNPPREPARAASTATTPTPATEHSNATMRVSRWADVAVRPQAPGLRGIRPTRRTRMSARLSPAPSAQGSDVIARAVGAAALGALAMIHVIDLPGTLGPTPLVGAGYLGIIAAATGAGGAMIARSHWLVWAATGGLAAAAMGGYV